jgi:hypothetical protein
MNPNDIPVPPPHDPSWYPAQKQYGIEDNIGVPKGRPMFTGALLDLPVAERKKHMWHVPKHLHNHSMYDVEPHEYKCKCDQKAKAKEDEAKAKDKKITDHESTIQQQQETVAAMAKHIKTLTETLNLVLAKYPV